MTNDTNKVMLWTLLGVIALAVVTSLIGGAMGWGTWGWGGMMGMMGVWMLVPLVFLIWLIMTLSNQNQPPHQETDALKIAEHRFAAGEIDSEEFERIRSRIKEGRR